MRSDNLPALHGGLTGAAERLGFRALMLNVVLEGKHEYMTDLRTIKSGALRGMDPALRKAMRQDIAFMYRHFRQAVALERLRMVAAIHGLDEEVPYADTTS